MEPKRYCETRRRNSFQKNLKYNSNLELNTIITKNFLKNRKSSEFESTGQENEEIIVKKKRKSFQFNGQILLKPIIKRNSNQCERKKIEINLNSHILPFKVDRKSISGKEMSNIYSNSPTKNNPNIQLFRNKNKVNKFQITCIDREIKPKYNSLKDLPVNMQFDENKLMSNEVYQYKGDKIEIIYNSLNNLRYTTGTQKGFNKSTKKEKENNQDVALILESVCGIKNYNIYCIMDGHGSNGHHVSNYIKDKIIQHFNNITFYFKKIKKKSEDCEYPENILDLIKKKLKKNNFQKIRDFYKLIDDGLSSNEIMFDINFSGSTCIILFQIGNYLISSNVGDSRAIMLKENSEIIELSKDQKPENENEKIRIEKCGGIISQCNDLYDDGKQGGPFRIWLKGHDYPGIAMSRSIGDKTAHGIGVISEPEILEFNIDDKCEYLVLGSDGIWSYLTNEKVNEIIRPFLNQKNAENACKEVIKKATLTWFENDKNVDDITVSIIYVK